MKWDQHASSAWFILGILGNVEKNSKFHLRLKSNFNISHSVKDISRLQTFYKVPKKDSGPDA